MARIYFTRLRKTSLLFHFPALIGYEIKPSEIQEVFKNAPQDLFWDINQFVWLVNNLNIAFRVLTVAAQRVALPTDDRQS